MSSKPEFKATVADCGTTAVPDPKDEKDKKEEVKGLGVEEDLMAPIRLVLTGKTLTDIPAEKRTMELARKYAVLATMLKTVMETDPHEQEIPIPGFVNYKNPVQTLGDMVEWMTSSQGSYPESQMPAKPLKSKVLKENGVPEWAATMLDNIGEDRQRLYDFILAANYLDIKSALHVGCAKVACLIKGQPLEKIKEILSKGITKKPEEKKEEKKA